MWTLVRTDPAPCRQQPRLAASQGASDPAPRPTPAPAETPLPLLPRWFALIPLSSSARCVPIEPTNPPVSTVTCASTTARRSQIPSRCWPGLGQRLLSARAPVAPPSARSAIFSFPPSTPTSATKCTTARSAMLVVGQRRARRRSRRLGWQVRPLWPCPPTCPPLLCSWRRWVRTGCCSRRATV